MSIDLEKAFATANRIHSQARVQINMGLLVQQMYHEGKITAEEASVLFLQGYQSDLVEKEIELDIKNDGIMPLTSETARRQCMRLKMAPTEEPK